MAERNWQEIEEEYRAGVLSIGSICRKHDVSRGSLRARATKDGWNRVFANEVREEVAERLTFSENPPGEDAVTKAAAMQVEAILGQRKDIAALRELVTKSAESLTRILNGEAEQHDAVTIGRTGIVGALDTLGSVMQRLIPMERAALGIDAPSAPGTTPTGPAGSPDEARPVVTFYLPQNHRNPEAE